MIIQMLMGDVGDGCHVEVHRRHTRLIQPVAGALDDCIAAAVLHHGAQKTLHGWCIRRRHVQPRVRLLPANARAHRSDHTDAPRRPFHIARGLGKDCLQQRAGGRLAVRARDAHDRKAAAGEILKRRTGPGQCLPTVRHLNVDTLLWDAADCLHRCKRQRAHDCHSALGKGGWHVLVPICTPPAHSHEQAAWLHQAAVGCHILDRHRGWIKAPFEASVRQRLQNLSQCDHV